MKKKLTREQLNSIIDEALVKAKEASDAKYTQLGGDRMSCGFAWVVVKPGNSLLAKILKERKLGDRHYAGGICVWNPGGSPVQNIDIKEAGAYAFARHLKAETGIETIWPESRLD